jgi:hypothetical protein
MEKLSKTIIFLPFVFCSCTHYYYVPSVQNVPLFREKNEYRISGTIGGGDETTCVEVQAAYSITDKVGVMADFMTATGGDEADKDYGKGNYFDGALGYYKPISKNGVFEVYGGLGIANQHHEYSTNLYNNGVITPTYSGKSDLSTLKVFVQPSLGLTFNLFDIGWSTRLNRLSFITVDNNINNNLDLYNELNDPSNKIHYYFEPAITLRGGWKNVKLQFQAAYSYYMNSPQLYFGEEYHISLGIYVAIAERYRKIDSKK